MSITRERPLRPLASRGSRRLVDAREERRRRLDPLRGLGAPWPEAPEGKVAGLAEQVAQLTEQIAKLDERVTKIANSVAQASLRI